jgi:hypothetical protein
MARITSGFRSDSMSGGDIVAQMMPCCSVLIE